MSGPHDLVRTSRFLALVLRHHPERIGLVLDAAGWARVDELLEALERAGRSLTLAELRHVVATNDKQRFAFSPDGQRLRASQGHSLPVDLGLAPTTPPALLYHGTARRFLASIRADGLRPGTRRHVHLSPDAGTARTVGGRHGRPVVLVVEAGRLHAAGALFFLSANGVWLTDAVPADHLRFPADG